MSSGLRPAAERLTDGVLAFQGGVLTTGDLLATWAVELGVHQLDLARDVEVAPPTPASLDLARRTVEALVAGGSGAPEWAERLPPTTDGRI